MNSLLDMLWVESLKTIRSRTPRWTAVGALLLPLGIAFLIFVSTNPEISQKLGLIGAKANLTAFAAADWSVYLGLLSQIVAAGGFLLSILIISWVFGREFTDGTLKDMLAVPVRRSTIVLAKFVVSAVWSAILTLVIFLFGVLMGALINLPGASGGIILQGSATIVITTVLVIAVVLPFALFASVGRGYLLSIGIAVLMLMLTNVIGLAGWGEYFPWAVPALYAQGTNTLSPVSYLIVIFTALAGVIATSIWWKYADQNR